MSKKPEPLPTARPICFHSQEEFEDWLRASRLFATMANVNPLNYCIDCLPEFKQAMQCAGRCAYPGTTFVQHEGGVYGRRPQLQRTKG